MTVFPGGRDPTVPLSGSAEWFRGEDLLELYELYVCASGPCGSWPLL